MSIQRDKYVFDLQRVSTEAYSYLIMYVLPKDFPHNKSMFVKALEMLLYEHIGIMLELSLNKLIRKHHLVNNDPYAVMSKRFNIEQTVLENTIDTLMSFRCITDQINRVVPDDTFHMWTLSPHKGLYILEDLGDFRINLFYENHVKGGKFLP